MSLITSMRRQTAVYWKRLTPNKFGQYSYDEPVQVDCRWDDAGREYRDKEGEKNVSTAVAYPDQVMFIGDRMMKGDLDSFTPLDPTGLMEAHEVVGFDQNPNFRNTETLLTAYLGKG